MGCSTSKLDDEDVVRLCHERKNFIKQALDQRNRFAYGHTAYIRSLRGVSLSLRKYVDDAELNFFLTPCTAFPSGPVRGVSLSPEEVTMISKKLFVQKPNGIERTINHMKAGWSPSISVEEWPEPTETVRTEYYHPSSTFGADGYLPTEAQTMEPSSSFFFSSPYARQRYPPASPQSSPLDFFWNPFSSLNTYPYGRSPEEVLFDDDTDRLRKVRQEEGIPELEEEGDDEDNEEVIHSPLPKAENSRIYSKPTTMPAAASNGQAAEMSRNYNEKVNEVKEFRSQGVQSSEISEARNAVEVEVNNEHGSVGNRNGRPPQTPGFTVYVNRRPTSIGEVMKDVEAQFLGICDLAHELSVILEASRTQPSSSPLESFRMLNPAALLRSASSRSSSFRFLQGSSSLMNDGYESSSNDLEETCIVPGSHKSTLDRLYAWEKKLYEEVKCGERVRIEYEKKCRQLQIHDVNGEEPLAVDRTRAAIRDLRTRLRVSISSVEYISKRIEVLRDMELHSQVVELIQGLARMWRTMAECHRIQKRTIDEAKLLLFSSSSAGNAAPALAGVMPGPSRSAATLEAELRNWASCLAAWIQAQRCYARALAGWIRRCSPPTLDATAPTPSRVAGGGGAPPVYAACVRWSRLMDTVSEAAAIEGVEMFAAGIASVAVGQGKEGAPAPAAAMRPPPPVPEAWEAAAGRAAELSAKVVCAGLAVAVGAVAELAASSAAGYEELVKNLESRRE